MGFIIQYGTRITWAVQDPVPNKKSRIHFIKKLTGLFYRLSQKKKKSLTGLWVNNGTRSVRKLGRLVKSLQGWVG